MSYQVLARRLRPQRFADVIGQEHVTETLRAAIVADRIAHAFLFTGPRGVGKTTTARILAKALTCEAGLSADPCNACSTCREVTEGHAFDVLEIDGASHTQVDRMRDLMETVAHRPIKSRFKIYIIDEVHMLSQHSFNALLKTLEEPPAHVKFIFATTDPHKILPTVLSRCQRYDLRRIATAELARHIRATVAAEGIALDDGGITLIAREAEGSLRDAQSLLEQVLAAGGGTDEASVRRVLGAADHALVITVSDAVLAGDAAASVRAIGSLHAHGYDARRFCRDLLEHIRHVAVFAATQDRQLVSELTDAEVEAVASHAARRSSEDIQRLFRVLLDAEESLTVPARTIEPQLVLEMAILRLATMTPLVALDEISARLAALDGGVRPRTAASTSAVRAAAPPRRGTPDEGGGIWDRFLAELRRDKVSLFMAVAGATLLGIDDDVMRIGLDNEPLRRELVKRESLERLAIAAATATGRPLRVEIAPVPKDRSAETPQARERERTEGTLADPLVQAAVDIFGGEVRSVRDRRLT